MPTQPLPDQPEERLIQLTGAWLEACVALDQRALAGLWTHEQWHNELNDPRRPVVGLVQGEDLRAVACGWLVVDELHITAVAVDPDHRRKGLGKRALEGLLEEARSQGAAHATLEVAQGNQAARRLYEGCGFATAGIRRAYYRNGDDALIQWMRLHNREEVRIAAHS
ncbi:MAG: ribosomal protein S18-alanine N-acetyltransferase [Vulcanococcus sp.]